MSFREFVNNVLSTRDYKDGMLEGKVIAEVNAYLETLNDDFGREKGFSFILFEEGGEVFRELAGVGGYNGVMIKSPHYIGLAVKDEDPEKEFYGSYYMQSVVKMLYDLKLGSCWINVRNVVSDKKAKLLGNNSGIINYLLAFGMADEKAIKHKNPQMTVTGEDSAYKQNPYGLKVNETMSSDKARNSVGEMVYLYDWGRQASVEDLESRGMDEIFFHVRNAASYKNLQPCRLILKDGEAELTVVNPKDENSYVDAGIMMYILDGLAKNIGVPGKWQFVSAEADKGAYTVVAKIEL